MDNTQIAYIELLGVTLAGVRKPDQGFYWTDLTGWWGLPELRGATDEIPGTHGSFERSVFLRSSRVLSLTGHILTHTGSSFMSARERLETALAAGGGVMRVHTNTYGTWERRVEIKALDIEPDHGRTYTKFVIDMLAPDPRRYGEWQQIGPVGLPRAEGGVILPQAMPWHFGSISQESRLRVPNGGALEMFPQITIEGGYSSVTVQDITTGSRLSLNRPALEDSVLVLDCGARRATLDGSDVTRWLTRRQWFSIKPGEEHEFRFEAVNPTADPQMRARIRIGAW